MNKKPEKDKVKQDIKKDEKDKIVKPKVKKKLKLKRNITSGILLLYNRLLIIQLFLLQMKMEMSLHGPQLVQRDLKVQENRHHMQPK